LNFFKSGDYHHNNQPLIKTLHTAIRTKDLDLYNLYEQSVKGRPPTTLRDTLEFVTPKNSKITDFGARQSIPLDQVRESAIIYIFIYIFTYIYIYVYVCTNKYICMYKYRWRVLRIS
jgi:hypothetical protein